MVLGPVAPVLCSLLPKSSPQVVPVLVRLCCYCRLSGGGSSSSSSSSGTSFVVSEISSLSPRP